MHFDWSKLVAIFVIVGPKEEWNLISSLFKSCKGKLFNLVGKTNLAEIFLIMKECDLFIGNDSGLMHLSAASNIPTIGLFGPTNDKLYAPFGKKCFIIRTKENYQDFNNIEINKNKSYMHSIKVEDVFAFINNKKII